MTTSLRFAAASDTGLMRQDNQDSGYAGPYLVAVADGVSGNAHGEVASSVTIEVVAGLDRVVPAAQAPDALAAAVTTADDALRQMAVSNPALLGMSTTLTLLLCGADTLHLAHVGDSRGYLLRDGSLQQVTKDHSLVQALVDDGRITRAEAAVHPQRSVIVRAVNGRGDVQADIWPHELRVGDRWLLCSDGLSDYVPANAIEETLSAGDDLDALVGRLVELANAAGGPDNITCVIADVVEEPADLSPGVVGAAAQRPVPPDAESAEPPTQKLPVNAPPSPPEPPGAGQARVAGTQTPAPADAPATAGRSVIDSY